MSANVALSETFDQWRVKTNELLVMTQTDGSPNFVKLTNTTDATQKEMFIDASTMTRIDVPSDSTVSFNAHITARSNNDLSCC